MRIEDAREDDLPAILAIYNDVLLTSTAIYREEPATLEERQAWGDPEAERLAGARRPPTTRPDGFATFGDFRAWPGYRFTVEHSVHVAAGPAARASDGADARADRARQRARQARDGRRHRCRQRRIDPDARALGFEQTGH